MSATGGPDRRGRHSSADDGAAGAFHPRAYEAMAFDPRSFEAGARRDMAPGHEAPRYEPSRYEPNRFAVPQPRIQPVSTSRADLPRHSFEAAERPTGGLRPSRVLDRFPDETGPLVEPEWWAHGCSDAPAGQLSARHGRDDRPADQPPQHFSDTEHPSAPLPPRPAGVWDRLHPRQDVPADDETIASPLLPGPHAGRHAEDSDDVTDAHDLDPAMWDDHDHTGGLDVIGAHVEDHGRRRGLFRRRRAAERHDGEHFEHDADVDADLDYAHDADHRSGRHVDEHHDDLRDDDLHDHDLYDHDQDVRDHDLHDDLHDDEIPIAPYDRRSGRRHRRRRPWAVIVSLLVLAGLVVGIVVGGQALLGLIDPSSRDYAGQGSGEVEVRVKDGDTLSDIARTLVDAGVIASIGPFIDAAETDPAAMGIQPGVYGLREKMSGQAALDRLLDPVARLVSRVTVPEGLTAAATLARLADATGVPVEELQAAATADPAAFGLPAWTNGSLEGFLFPATYDFEPETPAVEMLRAMVARANQAFTELQIPADRLQEVLTEASIVQAEAASPEDMAKVARVLENRIAIDMPLQLDTTVNYANGKSGITTTAEDRANPSPYNTYVHSGLPPGPISNPGEVALQAALAPADGNWLFFVVVDPDTGETRFAATAEEHAANVEIFRQWLRENPEG